MEYSIFIVFIILERSFIYYKGMLVIISAVTCDFQQGGILTSVDSDGPVQPPSKIRNSKCFQLVA